MRESGGIAMYEEFSEIVTCAQMKEIEFAADQAGLSFYQMMENAGTRAAGIIADREGTDGGGGRPLAGKEILVFCGRGNNGGDGYVAARRLAQAGASVTVALADGFPKTEDARKNAELIKLEQILALPLSSIFAETADILVDAIYGTGFHGELPGNARSAAALINSRKGEARIYALDIPSGLSGDLGLEDGALSADPDTVCADCTIVFHRKKPVHAHPDAAGFCGELVTVDIGIDALPQ